MSNVIAHDYLQQGTLDRLAALLDYAASPWAPGEAPPLAHWLAFLPVARQSAIGSDGHPDRSDFAPAAGLPRRMWAGSRIAFHAPLPIGSPLVRRTETERIDRKEGRSGALLFVTLRHELDADGVVVLTEHQDIVYREAAVPGAATPAPASAPAPASSAWTRTVDPTEAMLFRFSALTYNAHRIHYDRAYACDVEGYADLVVHGPLIATLLMDLALRNRPDARVAEFRFAGRRPLLAGRPFALGGAPTADGAELWAADADGQLCTRATIRFQP